MAKIRGFKPDLWTDEDFVEMSPFARLLWLGLWSYSCDNGHVADKPKQIKMRVLPTDDVNCSELLREIEAQGLIERADGWITTPTLTHHQKPDRRYFTTCEKDGCDAPPETVSQRESRRVHAVQTEGTHRAHGVSTPSAQVDGDGEVKGSDGERKRNARKRALPADWKPNEAAVTYAAGKRIDIEREAFKFRNHAASTGRSLIDWDRAFLNWLDKSIDFAPAGGRRKPGDTRPEGW